MRPKVIIGHAYNAAPRGVARRMSDLHPYARLSIEPTWWQTITEHAVSALAVILLVAVVTVVVANIIR